MIARRDGVEDVVDLRVGLRRVEVVQLLQLLLLQMRPALPVLELCAALTSMTDGLNHEGHGKIKFYTRQKKNLVLFLFHLLVLPLRRHLGPVVDLLPIAVNVERSIVTAVVAPSDFMPIPTKLQVAHVHELKGASKSINMSFVL